MLCSATLTEMELCTICLPIRLVKSMIIEVLLFLTCPVKIAIRLI